MKKSEVLRKLSALSKERPTPQYFDQFKAQVNSEENHRGAAILLCTNVENALEISIMSVLTPERTKKLFCEQGPLGSFNNKILMAYALNIFGLQTYDNLSIIRHIRNTFAHSKIPISYDTPQVRNACAFFTIPDILRPHAVGSEKEDASGYGPREKFQFMCDRLAHNLAVHNWNGVKRIKRAEISLLLDARFSCYEEVYATYPPLP